jgi:DNA-directed RNA polymerase subunit M
MFCKNCGSLLKPNVIDGKKLLACSCGYKQSEKVELSFKSGNKSDNLDIVEEDEPASRMIIDEECPKCGNKKAYYWTQQAGPSDEPEDQIYRCTKCGHGRREAY